MSRTKGYKCFNIKCGSCIGKTLCGEPEDTALVCVDRVIGKPMTNADRIRAMSDEELVNVVPCPLGFSMFRCPIERQCGPCKREWLQQPAEDDDHE